MIRACCFCPFQILRGLSDKTAELRAAATLQSFPAFFVWHKKTHLIWNKLCKFHWSFWYCIISNFILSCRLPQALAAKYCDGLQTSLARESWLAGLLNKMAPAPACVVPPVDDSYIQLLIRIPYASICHDLLVQRRWKKLKTSWKRAPCSCLSEDLPNPCCLSGDSLKTFQSDDGSDALLTWGRKERRARSVAVSETPICHTRIVWALHLYFRCPSGGEGPCWARKFLGIVTRWESLEFSGNFCGSVYWSKVDSVIGDRPALFFCLLGGHGLSGWSFPRQDWKISTEKQLQAADNMKASKVNRSSILLQVSWQQDGFAFTGSREIWRNM